MIMLAAGLAGVAALFFLSRPAGRRLLRRLDSPDRASSPPVQRSRALLLIPAGIAILIGAFLIGGGRGAVYVAAGLIIAGLAVQLIASGGRRRRSSRAQVEIADACRVLASELRIGKVPSEALAAAVVDHPILAEAERVHRLGGDVVPTWRSWSRKPGQGGLLELARGWELCQATGAPLADTLDQIADSLAADQTVRMMVAGELAAPRASGKIMAVLPLCGIGLGYLIGGDPLTFLWQQPVGWGCLLGGTMLAAVGILWIDALTRQAER